MITKEENEKILKVIEGQPTFQEIIKDLVPVIYSLAILSITSEFVFKELKNIK